MKRTIIYLLFIALTSAWGAEKIAFTTKVSGRVTLTTPQGQTNPLKRGTALNMDEKIVTGSDGSVRPGQTVWRSSCSLMTRAFCVSRKTLP